MAERDIGMTKQEHTKFNALRRHVADAIAQELEMDCLCKSYEGTWELMVSYPNYFEDEAGTANPDFYQITLHRYVIGPGRHYDWQGRTWNTALDKCKHDIDRWAGRKQA